MWIQSFHFKTIKNQSKLFILNAKHAVQQLDAFCSQACFKEHARHHTVEFPVFPQP